MTDLNEDGSGHFIRAIHDFHAARRKAALQNVVDHLLRRPTELLPYDQVRQRLRPIESARRVLKVIPIDKIVGSVNRYTDFTRSFLPIHESDLTRWARVRVAVENLPGLPPIEVYQVGDVYFILDGHHRVSVMREIGAKEIEAYVTPVYTRVPLAAGDSPDDLIIKSEYADFLTQTQLDHLRPDANLLVTAPGQYQKLLEHISVHRYFMGERLGREVSVQEAVVDWYDDVYQPIAQLIRDRNLLRDFPNRNETDLYLWLMEHRAALSGGEIGWEVNPERAAADLSARFSPTTRRRLPRIGKRIADLLIPDPLEGGPPPGAWRVERQSPHRGNRLFDDLVVTVTGEKRGASAVEIAIEVARREEARLTGLHVVSSEEQKELPEVKALRQDFLDRCAEAGIFGRFRVEVGKAYELLVQRSPWVDLIVFRLAYPPPTKILQRLRSGARMLIRRSASPLLAVPDAPCKLNSAVLSFGPGRKSEEALYVATYLAGAWKIALTVVTSQASGLADTSPTPLERARAYLEAQNVQATYIEETGDPARAALLAAESQEADFIITGGYEAPPIFESIRGSTVDRILRSTRRPVLICR